MKTRKRRSTLPEGYYHVYNRAARRLNLFADDADRSYFMFLLIRAARRCSLPVVAWCLVANHYHLLLRGCGKALGRMMRELESVYARRFNAKTGFNGCLFQGRFGSTWLPDMDAVAYVSRYIHANSLDEGTAPEDCVWSSAGVYLGVHECPDWMEISPVVDRVGGTAKYAEYLKAHPAKAKRDAERDAAQDAFVTFLEVKVVSLLKDHASLVGQCSIPVLVCLVASRHYAVRPRILARHFGFASGACVSALVSRMSKRLTNLPELNKLLLGC
jgi:REP element-mobilizing transposase RayT